MWTLGTPWYELVFRGIIIFVFMFVIMRVWGKKHLGELTATDFILLLFMSEAVQNSLIDGDKSVFGGMIVITTLFTCNVIVNKLTYHFPRLEKILDGEPKILIKDGMVIHSVMRKEQITQQELLEAIREEGVLEIEKVKQATIETNGHISVVPQ